jgi:hypothetical protein
MSKIAAIKYKNASLRRGLNLIPSSTTQQQQQHQLYIYAHQYQQYFLITRIHLLHIIIIKMIL